MEGSKHVKVEFTKFNGVDSSDFEWGDCRGETLWANSSACHRSGFPLLAPHDGSRVYSLD
ncbi:hypothetical protein DIPPA_00396 [Diplonema papillatum]|nr:hypothetical protein DIPPA_00396 [Diplonema papillatum]